MPENLKLFIAEESKKRGMTETAFIVNACWCFLEEPQELGQHGKASAPPTNKPAGPAPPDKPSAPDMDELRSICAGDVHHESYSAPIKPCPRTGFNEVDGETYRCSLAAGHKPPCRPGERV